LCESGDGTAARFSLASTFEDFANAGLGPGARERC
jgi:hypothetical protein